MAFTSEARIGFDTQKPEELLKFFILASSNPAPIPESKACRSSLRSVWDRCGAASTDFFCGSGTILAVAEKLGRRWIGCDLSEFAIQVTRKRLPDIHNSKDLMAGVEK
ncbi:MAG: DNA methyltransferase [Thermodesulfovibrionales bacterium]